MMNPLPFHRISLVGVGLIGGSWGLALKRRGLTEHVTGCDHLAVLDRAVTLGAIDRAEPDLATAVRGADLVILAAPVGAILEQLRQVNEVASPHALITDAGGTKSAILERARNIFGGEPLFVGGHPLAGRERSGIENASADLFEGTAYALTASGLRDRDDERVLGFRDLIESVGARPFWCNAETHDRALAFLSHLPQLLSTGLASTIAEEDQRRSLPLDLAATGFRDMTRLAESPYAIWRDVCLTNQENLRQALDALIGKLQMIRHELGEAKLEQEFEQALKLREHWRALHGG